MAELFGTVGPRRKSRNTVLQGDGAPVILRAVRRHGKRNGSRAFVLIVLCCALSLGPIFATAEKAVPTSSELLEQGRRLLEAGKIAEAELVLDRAEELAPSDAVILTLDAKVKGRLGEYAS